VTRPDEQAPLVLLQNGHETWRILGPHVLYGGELGVSEGQDRRYVELATVHGSLYDATARLHELEKGRS
jgi:hypothetical protein